MEKYKARRDKYRTDANKQAKWVGKKKKYLNRLTAVGPLSNEGTVCAILQRPKFDNPPTNY
jgi:hypothetical protein